MRLADHPAHRQGDGPRLHTRHQRRSARHHDNGQRRQRGRLPARRRARHDCLRSAVASTSGSRKAKPAAEPKPKRVKFAQKFDGYYSNNVCILLAVAGGLLSVWLGELPGINYAILGLVLGVIFTQIGIVPQNLLQKGQTSGFINMVVFAAIIPSLGDISLANLVQLIIPLIVVFAVSVVAIFLMMKVLPAWKIMGDKSRAFGIGFCQMFGFPSTYLISVEVCNAVAENEEENEFLMSKVMPRLVVGGMAAMVSIIVAGVMAGML